MPRWAEITHKQTIWILPCEGLNEELCRTDRVYVVDNCYPLKCRMERNTFLRTVLDGEECFTAAVFSTYGPVPFGARVFLSEEEKNTGDLNNSYKVTEVKESPDLFDISTILREAKIA